MSIYFSESSVGGMKTKVEDQMVGSELKVGGRVMSERMGGGDVEE